MSPKQSAKPKYFKTDLSKAAAKLKEQQEQESSLGFKFWNPKEGKNEVRILPPWSEEGIFYKEVYYHYHIGVDDETVICAKRTPGGSGKCYICEKQEQLRSSQDSKDRELASALRSRQRFFYNVIDINDVESGVQVFGSGPTIFNEVLSYFGDPGEWGDITDPENGYNIVIERSGTGIDTSYIIRARKNSSPVPIENWEELLNSLDDLVKMEEYEYTKALYEGEEVASPNDLNGKTKTEDTEEDEATPTKPVSTGAGKVVVKGKTEETEKKAEGAQPDCFGTKFDAGDKECKSCKSFGPCAGKFYGGSK